jgi:hypothetical protein
MGGSRRRIDKCYVRRGRGIREGSRGVIRRHHAHPARLERARQVSLAIGIEGEHENVDDLPAIRSGRIARRTEL